MPGFHEDAGITLKSSCLQLSTLPAQTVILIYKYMTYKQSEKNISKRAWDVAQMAECLPTMCEALSSARSTA